MRAWVTLSGIAPRYATRFSCTGAACEDNCCADGWGIQVDRGSFESLRRAPASEVVKRYRHSIRRLPSPAEDRSYAQLVPAENSTTCPMLASGGCEVHARLGEGWLCDTCFHYPRHVLDFAGTHLQTLSLSCPEAARLALQSDDALDLVPMDIRVRPSVVLHAQPTCGLSLDAMSRVHAASVSLMRRREMSLWMRLAVLGAFCEGLQALIDAGRAGESDLLVEMVSSHPDEILASLDAVPSDLPRQALAFARLITALTVRAASETQQRVFDEAARGLTGSEARETYVNTVIASYKRGLCHMDESGPAVKRLLEHYTLNEMFAGAFQFVRGVADDRVPPPRRSIRNLALPARRPFCERARSRCGRAVCDRVCLRTTLQSQCSVCDSRRIAADRQRMLLGTLHWRVIEDIAAQARTR